MTASVTVKTHGHTVIATIEPMYPNSFKQRELLKPGVVRTFTVHDSQSLHVEELPSFVIEPIEKLDIFPPVV
jgi:hypothetical protein